MLHRSTGDLHHPQPPNTVQANGTGDRKYRELPQGSELLQYIFQSFSPARMKKYPGIVFI